MKRGAEAAEASGSSEEDSGPEDGGGKRREREWLAPLRSAHTRVGEEFQVCAEDEH